MRLLAQSSHALSAQAPDRLQKLESAVDPSILVNFQVHEPVLTPTGPSDELGCVHSQFLMEHVFAFSYGNPFVGMRSSSPTALTFSQAFSITGSYTPPPCDFNRVTMNFTVTSKGRQFDRLGLMYLGDIEVFRTSTAEPTKDGIVWTYIKEMDQYNILWKSKQRIIFDLGNLVNEIYTGSFNTTLVATFFTVSEPRPSADLILPISARKSSDSAGSSFSLPDQVASIEYKLPQNIKRAVVSISACGQAREEFWYTNVLSSNIDTFADAGGSLDGYSPFREVQLLIDGQIAGVSWPFPVIFTGGIAPGLWRPIAGIDAFDLREHEIDITAWLPLLCDGAPHRFEIRVVGLDDDGTGHATLSNTVGSNWVVTGKIFMFLDKNGFVTTGSSPAVIDSLPQVRISSTVTTNSTGANETLIYETRVSRDLYIVSSIITSDGYFFVNWTQHLSYSSLNSLLNQGRTQLTSQDTVGLDRSSSGYVNTYRYPLTVNSSFFFTNAAGNFGIHASVYRSLDYNLSGPSIFPSGIQNLKLRYPSTVDKFGSRPMSETGQTAIDSPVFFNGALLSTTQSGNAKYLSAGDSSYSYGKTEQEFSFKGTTKAGPHEELPYEFYNRHVIAVNSTVTEDSQSPSPAGTSLDTSFAVQLEQIESPATLQQVFSSVKAILGRGPGKTKAELNGIIASS